MRRHCDTVRAVDDVSFRIEPRRDVVDAVFVLAVAILGVVASSLIWRRALRGYTGASG